MRSITSSDLSLDGARLHRTGGFVLVTALLFLVALTIVGLSAIGANVIEERMSGQARDRQIAIEAAEAALRDGERYLSANRDRLEDANLIKSFPHDCGTSGDSKGMCQPAKTGAPIWRELDGMTQADLDTWLTDHTIQFGTASTTTPIRFSISPDPDNSSLVVEPARQPRFFIEGLAKTGSGNAAAVPWRITAVGFGRHETTRVTLQSVFIPLPKP